MTPARQDHRGPVSRIHATAEATISLWLTVATAPYDRRVRDLDTIDGELQIIAAVREAVRAVGGRPRLPPRWTRCSTSAYRTGFKGSRHPVTGQIRGA
jgi:hypothetical protein